MTQFGLYSETTPRNDASPARGQWNLADAYRYLSEAYGGYHFNVMHGINVDAGIFMSYIGLFSYYNFDNWACQPSYISSNTPWFFNGVRVQIFPTEHLKIEPWFVNRWQAYGPFNGRPRFGMQILWRPNGWFSILGNQYALGEDALNTPGLVRYHTDDSMEVKYYDRPGRIPRLGGVFIHRRYGMRTRRRRELCWRFRKGAEAKFSRLHAVQPYVVSQRQVRANSRRRQDQQSRPLSGSPAADQWCNRRLWHALFHGRPRRPLQSMGCLRNV
jgi:hypothetical protein